jgi:Ca2+/Na+ antiporter
LKKTAAIVQVIIILLIVGYATTMLYLGRFEQSLVMLPLMMAYYVFVTARHQRRQAKKCKNGEDPAC